MDLIRIRDHESSQECPNFNETNLWDAIRRPWRRRRSSLLLYTELPVKRRAFEKFTAIII